MRLSFIIIGKNEEKTLGKLFKSINELIDFNSLDSCETIYVDSSSKDKSLEIAKQSDIASILKINGESNAAIARNVGAKYANGEILFFIDGDMVLRIVELDKYIQSTERHIATGRLQETIYKENKLERTYLRNYPKGFYGGIFLIKKSYYDSLEGMDEYMKKGQDYDFFFKAMKKNLYLKVFDEVICEHKTSSYRADHRIKYNSIMHSKYRARLIRKNFDNPAVYSLLLNEYYPLISLILLFYRPLTAILLLAILLLYKIRKDFSIKSFYYEFLRQLNFIRYLIYTDEKKSNYHVEVIEK